MAKQPKTETEEEDAYEAETAAIDKETKSSIKDTASHAKRDPVSPPVPPKPAPLVDVPANEPYPTGGEQPKDKA
jgi:hypothetical protein